MDAIGKALHDAQRIGAERIADAFDREQKVSEDAAEDARFHDGKGGCGYRWDAHNPAIWGGTPTCPTEAEAQENWGHGHN